MKLDWQHTSGNLFSIRVWTNTISGVLEFENLGWRVGTKKVTANQFLDWSKRAFQVYFFTQNCVIMYLPFFSDCHFQGFQIKENDLSLVQSADLISDEAISWSPSLHFPLPHHNIVNRPEIIIANSVSRILALSSHSVRPQAWHETLYQYI